MYERLCQLNLLIKRFHLALQSHLRLVRRWQLAALLSQQPSDSRNVVQKALEKTNSNIGLAAK